MISASTCAAAVGRVDADRGDVDVEEREDPDVGEREDAYADGRLPAPRGGTVATVVGHVIIAHRG